MTLWEKNLTYIRQQSPALAEQITTVSVLGGKVEYEPAKKALRLYYGQSKIYLHSLYDQKREFKEIFRDVSDRIKRLIVFGLGDGTILTYIQKHYPHLDHLVIIEPYGEVVQHFLTMHSFEKAFTPFNKVSLLINRSQKDVILALEDLLVSEAAIENYNSVVSLFAYHTAHSEYYRELMQATLRVVRFYRVNKTTQETFRLLWLVNFWRNLKHLATDLAQLKTVFKGRPAIIVSAGPSLNKNIHLLQGLRDKALIIAVGSAITILENKGIAPHFRVAVDATKENELLFKEIDTKRCPLIYSDAFYFPSLDKYEGPKVHMTIESQQLPQYLFAKAEAKHMLVRSGFTVANVALDMLFKMECSRIIVIGQDLCYTEDKLHADGAWDDELDGAFIKKEIETENVFGEKVYTDRAFLGMKLVFEKFIQTYPEAPQVINASEGGLKIDGMLHQSLQQTADEYLLQHYDFDAEIKQAIVTDESQLTERQERIEAVVAKMEESIAELMKINEKNMKEMEKILRLVLEKGGKKQILKGVEKITKAFARLNCDEMYNQVIFPSFSDKFNLRLYASSEKDSTAWREVMEKELKVFWENAHELQEHLQAYSDLIAEYQGKKTFNIIIE